MLEVGTTLERYTVVGALGEGGMSVVYRVVHEQLGSDHALKILQVASHDTTERLLEEGRAQARLSHPNLVAVTDTLEVRGAPALVLEYVDGPTLETWLTQNRPSLSQAVRLFFGIVRGVEAAHDAGMVHCDLKPGNVLLSRTADGVVPKVSDFGLVQNLSEGGHQQGHIMGTPHYMAPEQWDELPDVDQRADLFALGCILYELVTGTRAFDGGNVVEIANAIRAGDYVRAEQRDPTLPRVVTNTIRRLLVPERQKRIATCSHLIELLFSDALDAGDYAVRVDWATLDTGGPDSLTDEPPAPLRKGAPTPVGTERAAPPRRESGAWAAVPPSRRWPIALVLVCALLTAAVVGAVLGRMSAPKLAEPGFTPSGEVRNGAVEVVGDATAVELLGPAGAFAPGTLPAGTYAVRAAFGGELAPAGAVEVVEGEHVRVRCDAGTGRCSAE